MVMTRYLPNPSNACKIHGRRKKKTYRKENAPPQKELAVLSMLRQPSWKGGGESACLRAASNMAAFPAPHCWLTASATFLCGPAPFQSAVRGGTLTDSPYQSAVRCGGHMTGSPCSQSVVRVRATGALLANQRCGRRGAPPAKWLLVKLGCSHFKLDGSIVMTIFKAHMSLTKTVQLGKYKVLAVLSNLMGPGEKFRVWWPG